MNRQVQRQINLAADRAERACSGWHEAALAKLIELGQQKRVITGESVRAYAYAAGLELPPDHRAWGAVFQRASKDGLIARDSWYSAASSHGSAKPVWRFIEPAKHCAQDGQDVGVTHARDTGKRRAVPGRARARRAVRAEHRALPGKTK